MTDYQNCTLCPRNCGCDRSRQTGYCGMTDKLTIARAALHFWEEPCISGEGSRAPGSGTVFFTGCSLGCCFCQNHLLSKEHVGKQIDAKRLAEIFLELQEKGAANINLVTPDHFLPDILSALKSVEGKLIIPVACNCSGYETVCTVDRLSQYVDIFMPDVKFFSPELSFDFAGAKNYFKTALAAIKQMLFYTGAPVFSQDGMLVRGVILRHLILPGHTDDSLLILDALAKEIGTEGFIISLMSQYTPYFDCGHKELNRRLSSYEYRKVIDHAEQLGFEAIYTQQRSSAKEEYTPPFDAEGV